MVKTWSKLPKIKSYISEISEGIKRHLLVKPLDDVLGELGLTMVLQQISCVTLSNSYNLFALLPSEK